MSTPSAYMSILKNYPKIAFGKRKAGSTYLYIDELTSEEQRDAFGERLYDVVSRVNPTNASKITGMLLEMDRTEILKTLVSPDTFDSHYQTAVRCLSR